MSIKAALIDLSGTLHIEDEATPNAVEALERLRKTGVAIRFVTNTTKESKETIFQRLNKIGFNLAHQEIYSSLTAGAEYVTKNKMNPFYILTDDARTGFPPEDNTKSKDSVVVGLAVENFHYENLNKAFNILISENNHPLVAINQSKYYKRSSGLALGAGCFIKGLEFSTGKTAILIGKPSPHFFKSAIPEGVLPQECVMIGDDPNDDIVGAMKIGIQGILVKTGKYLPHVVLDPPPTALVENFDEAVNWIIKENR